MDIEFGRRWVAGRGTVEGVHVRTYHFEGLTPSQAADLAGQVVGAALEFVRDGYHVTRDIEGDVVALRWQAEDTARMGPDPRYPELWGGED